MVQITTSKEAYDKMVAALTLLRVAIENGKEEGTVSVDALEEILEAAGYPEI